MKLSICMMVKNEEKYLDKCLTSLQALRDALSSELIIVDTGSTDNTVEIAKKYTEKVYFHEWNNNFSEMRNITIDYAKGQWVLIVDGDEVFKKTHDIIKFLKSKESYKYGAVAVKVINLTTEDEDNHYVILQSPRLFKNNKDFFYKGIVHNEPFYKGQCLALNDEILHYGYINTDKELMERKFKRTSKLLKDVLEKNPEDIYYRFQLSVSYFMHGDNKEALIEAEKAYNILRKTKEYSKYIYLYCQLAKVYLANNYLFKAVEICEEGLKYEDEYIDLYFYLAQAKASLEEYKEALLIYEKYLNLVDNYDNLSVRLNLSINMHTLSSKSEAYHNMAVILYKDTKYEEAFKYFSKIDDRSYFNISYRLYIELCIKLSKLEELKQFYNIVDNIRGNDLKEKVVVTIEEFINKLDKESKLEVNTILSEFNDGYGDLNKIRVAFKEQNYNIESMIQSFIEKVDLNLTHEFYGDIIYYLINLKYSVDDLLYEISNENIAMYMEYLINKYEDFSYLTLDYIKKINIESFTQLTTSILLSRCLLISDKSNISKEQYKEVFNDYINNGIQYIATVYTPFVIENELTKEVKNEEDKFFIYMFLAENIKEQNGKEYINYLRKAVSAYPYMKDGIEMLLEDFYAENNSVQDEFEQYKVQIKNTIKSLISNGDIDNAEALIAEYEQIVKDDVEMVLLRSEIALKKIKETSNIYKM